MNKKSVTAALWANELSPFSITSPASADQLTAATAAI